MTQGVKNPGGIPQVPPSVWTDGVSITGNGTQNDPLVASGSQANTARTAVSDTLAGMALQPTTFGGFHAGKAIADGTSGIDPVLLGVALESVTDAGDDIRYQYEGIVTLTTAQWDAVAGTSGGLSAGSKYFVSETTAGHIQSTPPTTSGHQVRLVGIALSTTQLQLQLCLGITIP